MTFRNQQRVGDFAGLSSRRKGQNISAEELAFSPRVNQGVRVYLNPNTGRFWTMDDPDYGDQEDTASLHKYLYCSANPANRTDPSGNQSDTTELALEEGSGALDGLPNLSHIAEGKVGSKVEVRFSRLGPEKEQYIPPKYRPQYHAYIITTDLASSKMGIFRGQPGHTATGSSDPLKADYGLLTYYGGRYTQEGGTEEGHKDADPDNTDPRKTVSETTTPWIQLNVTLNSAALKIKSRKLKYHPLFCNSNHFASSLLRLAGFTPPDLPSGVNAFGWNVSLQGDKPADKQDQ